MKPYQIIPDGIGNPKDFFRPAFCYAHGALECDLNKDGDGQSDYFYLEKRAEEIRLHDDCWAEDCVTGNASGSYTFNAWQAEENVCHNLDLLGEALTEFGCDASYLMENGAEACDVTIRCYVLGSAIDEAINELLDED